MMRLATIICKICEETGYDADAVLDVLKDWKALSAIGVTDEDQDSVEKAYRTVKMYKKYKKRYGEAFDGDVGLALIEKPKLTDRLVRIDEGDGFFVEKRAFCTKYDYEYAKYGKRYISEWMGRAIDITGQPHEVTWRFDEIRGQEQDPKDYDWGKAHFAEMLPTARMQLR